MGLNLQGQFLHEVENLMGAGAAGTFRNVMAYADQHPEFIKSANIFGLAALLISASGIFAQLKTSLNKIFCCPRAEDTDWKKDLWNYLAQRAVSVSIVFVFVFVSIASLAASTLLPLIIHPKLAGIGHWLHFAGTSIVFTVIFTGIFHWMPDKMINWRASWLGGITTAILFMTGKFLITLFLERGNYDLAYGAAGSIIVLLLWVYYSSFTIFLGAEVASTKN